MHLKVSYVHSNSTSALNAVRMAQVDSVARGLMHIQRQRQDKHSRVDFGEGIERFPAGYKRRCLRRAKRKLPHLLPPVDFV
jgi:hypothetical protein